MGAISHGISIVEVVVAAGRSGLSLSRIADETGLPKSSVHRLLKELVDQSLLIVDAETRHYRGGLRLAKIGSTVISDYDLRTIARPALRTLQESTGQVATLGILDGDVGVYIDKIEPTNTVLKLHSEIGKQFPLHCTGLGKVLLAHADSRTQKRILKRKLDAMTPHTITDPKKLAQELDTIRAQGYGFDREEITRGLVCAAAPVWGVDGSVAGAISCTMPSYVAEEAGDEAVLSPVLRAAEDASA